MTFLRVQILAGTAVLEHTFRSMLARHNILFLDLCMELSRLDWIDNLTTIHSLNEFIEEHLMKFSLFIWSIEADGGWKLIKRISDFDSHLLRSNLSSPLVLELGPKVVDLLSGDVFCVVIALLNYALVLKEITNHFPPLMF